MPCIIHTHTQTHVMFFQKSIQRHFQHTKLQWKFTRIKTSSRALAEYSDVANPLCFQSDVVESGQACTSCTKADDWKQTHQKMYSDANWRTGTGMWYGLTSSGTDELMNTTVPPPSWEREKRWKSWESEVKTYVQASGGGRLADGYANKYKTDQLEPTEKTRKCG